LVWLLLAAAWAGPELRDSSTTTLGVSGAWSASAGKGDLDVWLGQRLRWGLGEVGPLRTTLLVDGRLRFDAVGGPPIERAQVRALGVRVETDRVTIDVGRTPIFGGGPRLIDGLQVRLHPTPGWDLGAWVGLAPDLFTTRPMLRPGFGPIVGYRGSWLQLSLVGEVLLWDGGLDRAAALAQARIASEPGWAANARLDVQLADSEGRAGLADAAVMARWRPASSLRLDVLADAYSSLRYLRSEQLDPSLRRFEARIDALGLGEGITQDKRDDRLFQLYGANARWSPGGRVAPYVDVLGRTRWHAEPELRFSRVGAGAGLFLMDGAVEVGVDGNAMTFGGEPQGDAGLRVAVWPWPEGGVGADASVRALVHPAYDGRLGWYGDLFVDVSLTGPVDLMAGASMSAEPDLDRLDVGYTGFVRLAARFRGGRPAYHDASGSRSPQP
jgi:hypothetical protein